MLFLDGVYVDRPNGTARFRWVKSLTGKELTQLAHTIAHRVGRFLERQGLLERDAENSYLSGDAVDDDPRSQLCGHSITYRIAVGPQAGRKVFTLQTLPACDPEDQVGDTVGKAPDEAQDQTLAEHRAAMTWAQRLKRVFNIDIETCRECGGAMRDLAG